MAVDLRTLPAALIEFDRLPDAAHVRQPVVQALFAISAPTVWRRVRSGRLPAPRRYGVRHAAWNVGELRRVLAEAVR